LQLSLIQITALGIQLRAGQRWKAVCLADASWAGLPQGRNPGFLYCKHHFAGQPQQGQAHVALLWVLCAFSVPLVSKNAELNMPFVSCPQGECVAFFLLAKSDCVGLILGLIQTQNCHSVLSLHVPLLEMCGSPSPPFM